MSVAPGSQVASLVLVGFMSAATWFVSAPNAHCEQIGLDVGVWFPTMMADQKETNYFRIALTGFDVPKSERRPAVNTAIVIDKSGSMSGKKIAQAREAAVTAVKRLRDDDIVSVILYADSAEVLVPATKASDREAIIEKIRSVGAGGSTALFAGVSKGAAEVRKFLDSEFVNRVILLSDGKANVGPQSPRELERLGASLVKEGISVSTLGLGLGYNEDLMSRLASAGSGNHMFVEQADDLVAVFQKEFNDLMSVVASDFEIHAEIGEGVRPVKVLNTKADISGQDIYIPLAQLYARQERYFIVEVEVDAGRADSTRKLATVSVEYTNMLSKTTDRLSSAVEIRFTNDRERMIKDQNQVVAAACEVQLANERNMRATELRDAGKIEAAKELLLFNSNRLQELETKLGKAVPQQLREQLRRGANINRVQSEKIAEPFWEASRKEMRAEQVQAASQQPRK
jgi:Ca-activated chloride channel family protein